MTGEELLNESAINDLVKRLPSLEKHDYNALDKVVRHVANKHGLSTEAIQELFKQKFKKTPKEWITGKLDEDQEMTPIDIGYEVEKMVDWFSKKINLKTDINVDLSQDEEEASEGHHTGKYIPGSDTIWVYAKNRNLVDICRTVFHEMIHVRQQELNMLKPGCSYPGSPVEAMADVLAGKYVKIFGKLNPKIYQ